MISKEFEVTLGAALQEARQRNHEHLCIEHLLYALLKDEYGVKILEHCGASTGALSKRLERFFQEELDTLPGDANPAIQQTVGFERLMERAFSHIQYSGKKEVDASDILAAMLEEEKSHAAFYLQEEGVTRLDVLNYISHGVSKVVSEGIDLATSEVPGEGDDERRGALDSFAVNLNKRAAEGKIDPLIGRTAELRQCVRILCRRRKNNPLFVGEPGVGKTALAEGLALMIERGEAPAPLKGFEILALDLPSIVAGTKFRGDFEQRLKAVIHELNGRKNLILYLDEVHTIVGAGATSESFIDASSILKPALAAGEIRCIGSTTYDEFKNHFEKDRGLSRRFQKIVIDEPSVEETFKILRGLKSRYEEHHSIQYTHRALRAAAELSAKHINDRFLPDKAIDVIDEAAANVKLDAPKSRKTVRPCDIEKIVAEIARVPVRSVSSSDRIKLGGLERELKRVVFGQDDAIILVTQAIKRARAGLSRPDKPIGCFLFTGPTGVGKTEVAKQVATVLGNHFACYDMSEYMEKHAVARLIGSPPGYVGFDQGGLLVDEIRRNPYTVLLLDEVEKAHPDLFSILLQVMDHATLTDNTGKKANFRNVILIMTSNAGARELAVASIGFQADADDSRHKSIKAVEKVFTPEFRNRLDTIVSFSHLPLEVIERVVHKFINEISLRLTERNVELSLAPEVYRWLAESGYDRKFGARSLARLIQQEVETPLADELLFGKLERGGVVAVGLEEGKLVFQYA